MAISSLDPQMSPDDLHVIAVGFTSLKEANSILEHPNCSEKTRQMVVAKLHLFGDELKSVHKNYHSDILAVAQEILSGPTATTG